MNRGYSAADAVAVDAYSTQLQYTMVIYWLLNLIIFDRKSWHRLCSLLYPRR
jgi:hypothetical protein